jgi:hypothetical protein
LHPGSGARFVQVGSAPDEIVRLSEGTLTVEVSPLARGERFRVVTADAEVEVRGTAFDVTADHDHLATVRVLHGRVEVRPLGGAAVLLAAGERWSAPVAAATAPVPTRATAPPTPMPPTPTAPRVRRPPVRPSALAAEQPDAGTRRASPGEEAFAEGWNRLSAGHADEAAAAFARAEDAEAVREDAGFWLGIALARGAHRDRAIAALHRFLAAFPTSARAGEASVVLGWQLLAAGEVAEAERRFQAGANDPSAEVRGAAAKGLAALGARRPPG